MIVVLILSCCPSSLCGDVSKWLFEIDTNVFVGRTTARVKDELWARVERTAGNGHAVLLYTSPNEQRFECLVHNGNSVPRDYDGITLMCRPS